MKEKPEKLYIHISNAIYNNSNNDNNQKQKGLHDFR